MPVCLPDHSAAALGLSPIHRACLIGNLDRVKELTTTENVNSLVSPRNEQPVDEPAWPSGETPLMLAALMGHLKVFEHLVRKGGDYRGRDNDDLPLQFYSSEREFAKHKRALYVSYGVGFEHSKAHHAREAIIDLLDHPARLLMMTSNISNSGYPDFYLAKEGSKIKLFARVDKFDTGDILTPEKTVGAIKAHDSYDVLRVAVSGFKGRSVHHSPQVLDREYWNKVALTTVSRIIGIRFNGNYHDNGAKPPMPHHLGRVQAGHVEVQLATFYVVEMAKKHAQKEPGSDAWSISRKMRYLRKADMGPDRHAVLFLNSHACASCLKYVQALSNYTEISFFIKGGVGMGPIVRSKTGRKGAARDQIMEAFEDTSDEEEEEEQDNDRPSIVEASQPAAHTNAYARVMDHSVPQEGIILDNDAAAAVAGAEEDVNWDLDSDSSDGTMAHTPSSTPSPIVPSQEPQPVVHAQLAFEPQLEAVTRPADVQAFRERMTPFVHVQQNTTAGTRTHRTQQRLPPRHRTYEERMRYRNPWPAPILTEPEYLAAAAASSSSYQGPQHQQQQQQSHIQMKDNAAYDISNNSRERGHEYAQMAMLSAGRSGRDLVADMDELNIDMEDANMAGDISAQERRERRYIPRAQRQQQQQRGFRILEAPRSRPEPTPCNAWGSEQDDLVAEFEFGANPSSSSRFGRVPDDSYRAY